MDWRSFFGLLLFGLRRHMLYVRSMLCLDRHMHLLLNLLLPRELHILREQPCELIMLRLIHLDGAIAGNVSARRAEAAL